MHALPLGRQRFHSMMGTLGAACLGLALVVGAWWLAARILVVDAYLLPAPPDVFYAFISTPRSLLRHGWVTLVETGAGFGIAAVAGVAAGTVLATSRLVEQLLYPTLVVLHGLPKVALAPLLIVWMGFGQGPRIVMVALVCFFPIVTATASGLMATPTELLELARALAASRWHSFTKVRFPAALPQMATGFRTALPLATVGAVIGEMSGGSTGLGAVIARASGSGDMALAFAAIGLLCLISLASIYAARGVEHLLRRWTRPASPTR
jgi:NitT/TauT family transport system permease protein